jgi:hypothetical protein
MTSDPAKGVGGAPASAETTMDIRIKDGINWVPEIDGAFVLLPDGHAIRLTIAESVIWDLIHHFPNPDEVLTLIKAIFQADATDSQRILSTSIIKWKHQGMLD